MSAEIDALTWFEEVLFYRLIVTVDDYGIYPAEPVVLAHILFPRKENVSRKMVEEALKHMEKLRLIRRWKDPEKGVFLKIVTWDKHQRLRNSRHRFPMPAEDNEEEMISEQAEPDDSAAQSEKEEASEEEEASEAEECQEDEAPKEEMIQASESVPVITLPLNDGSEFPISQADVDEYTELYPAVNVPQELRNMRGWCLSNVQKRKTSAGIRRFINSWLSRAQDQGRGGWSAQPQSKQPVYENPYLAMIRERERRNDTE